MMFIKLNMKEMEMCGKNRESSPFGLTVNMFFIK